MIPNLFDYATSELSQDAFLAWLFKWAEKENKSEDEKLHTCARETLELFISSFEIPEVDKIKVVRQRKNIDLWITINDEYHLIIEDKTSSREHDNQLQRYKEYAREWFAETKGTDFENHFEFVYYKSGDVTSYEAYAVKKAGYRLVSRIGLLSYLCRYDGENAILLDYRNKLAKKQAVQELAFTLPFADILQKKDKSEYVKGFYQVLEPLLVGALWNKVNNPGRQFYGMWWFGCDTENCRYYLQFNEFDLQIRIGRINPAVPKSKVRTEVFSRIMKAANKGRFKGFVTKPARFGIGNSMAVASIDKSLWLTVDEKGCLDMDAILDNLREIEAFLWEDVLGN